MKKIILQLCADTGSDTKPYQDDPNYEVILIGSKIGVENYHPPKNVNGIIANPPCTNFSSVRTTAKTPSDEKEGMRLVIECQRIIKEANPQWWAIENPATGKLKKYLRRIKKVETLIYLIIPIWIKILKSSKPELEKPYKLNLSQKIMRKLNNLLNTVEIIIFTLVNS